MCFFFSGVAGLIYQVAWGKALGLVFGHTAYAIATVLAVFMAGLAAGSAYLGRWKQSHAEPLKLYAWIELGVAATGALSLLGLEGVRSLYFAAYPAIHEIKPLLLALRFVGAGLVLFLPTFLMGGTLPILVRGVAGKSKELGSRVSRLYWVNTLGAVAGTIFAGFLLLPALGLRLTIACAVALNLLAGLVAQQISRGANKEGAESSGAEPASADEAREDVPQAGILFLLIVFGFVGATAIAYEICWTRLLATILGSSTYAFTLMLATFLGGIVLGSFLFEKWVARGREVSFATISRTQTWTGLAALLFLFLFNQLPTIVPPILRATHGSFGGLVLAQFVTSALAMLPAAVVFGFNFPAVVVLLTGKVRKAEQSATVGVAYAANTIGAIGGAIFTGFWLVPMLGSFRVLALTAGINLILAIALELRSVERHAKILAVNAALVLLVAIGGLSPVFYNSALASYSTVLYWNLHQSQLTLAENAGRFAFPFTADGLNSSIAVIQGENYLGLTTNGKVDATNRDAPTQLLLADLGAVFGPAPRRVLIIGFGSGMTAAALAKYPDVERIDCVEIEPAVLEAARYLETLNHGVLRDPKLHMHLDDARNFLLTSRDKFDLIISEPSNPWIAGVATLFTDEYYAAVRAHLAPDGNFVQWVQGYSLDPADLRMVLATVSRHFPETTLWHAQVLDFMVLARLDTRPMNFNRMRELWKNTAVREDFASLELRHPEGILAYYSLDDAAVRKLGAGSVLNTDDRTLLEYHAPRSLLDTSLADKNLKMLQQQRTRLLPANLDPAESRRVLLGMAETHFALGDNLIMPSLLGALENEPASAELEILRGQVALEQNQLDAARRHFESATALDANSLEAKHWLAVTAHRQNDRKTSEKLIAEILERDPRFQPALTDRVRFATDFQEWPTAIAAQEALLNATDKPAAIEYCRLAEFLLTTQQPSEAEKAFLRGNLVDPYNYACNRDLAELYRQTGHKDRALKYLEIVEKFFPDVDPALYVSLASVNESLGDHGAARRALQKGARIFPNDESLRKAASSN
ncbi:MAG TPA: fused MFS/spermidine synthase [Candidatus Baltobacteraceae bacterium]|nr:fused MFS/spermidine synthase [Candidatus Baltobacteraceae bacterium]